MRLKHADPRHEVWVYGHHSDIKGLEQELNRLAMKWDGKELGSGTMPDTQRRGVEYEFPTRKDALRFKEEADRLTGVDRVEVFP